MKQGVNEHDAAPGEHETVLLDAWLDDQLDAEAARALAGRMSSAATRRQRPSMVVGVWASAGTASNTAAPTACDSLSVHVWPMWSPPPIG